MKARKFKIGDTVEVYGYPGKLAKIEGFSADIDNCMQLDSKIGGFALWNVIDLILVEAAPEN